MRDHAPPRPARDTHSHSAPSAPSARDIHPSPSPRDIHPSPSPRDFHPPHPYLNPPPSQQAFQYLPQVHHHPSTLPRRPLRRTTTPTIFPSVSVPSPSQQAEVLKLSDIGDMALPELLKGIDPHFICNFKDIAPELYDRLLHQPAPASEEQMDVPSHFQPSLSQATSHAPLQPQALHHPHPHQQAQLHHVHEQQGPTQAQISSMLDQVVSATTSPSSSRLSPPPPSMHVPRSMPVPSFPLGLQHQQMVGFLPPHVDTPNPSLQPHVNIPHTRQFAPGRNPRPHPHPYPQQPISQPMSRAHSPSVVAAAVAAAATAAAVANNVGVGMGMERDSVRGSGGRGIEQRGESPRANGGRRRARVGEKRSKTGRRKESGRDMVKAEVSGAVLGNGYGRRGNPAMISMGRDVKEEVLVGSGIGIELEELEAVTEEFEGGGLGDGADGIETKKCMRAERNRQSAAASRERKKLHIMELERRVAMLSRENAALQCDQFGVIEERIEKERVLLHDNTVLKEQVVLKDITIGGLSRQLEDLHIHRGPVREALRRPKTWDAAEWSKENNASRKL